MANHGRPREVINAVRKKYPPLVSIATGSYNAKRKIIYKAKGVKDDDTMEMDRGGDVAPQFARTLNGERFLVKDSTIQTATGASRMVVFASDFGVDLLADSRTVFCDGTFDAVPSPFTQLFTIHAYVSESVVRPVVFCFLSDKQTASYEAVLKIVSESHPRLTVWEPLLVICDFEIALKNAFRSQFPRTCVQGCLFHLLQSWRRKAEQLHIYEEFTKGSIKDFWARLKSIPFIDASQTKQFFDLIVATVAMPIPQNIQDFIDYLSRFYIESTDRFPPSMWSVVDRTMNGIHRTTNVVETWHKMLTSVFSKKKWIVTSFDVRSFDES
ncbi:hypothetical protein L5515_002540 [Caenorhabditis briggsae]|uniref:MULE transposase domain-containing protein n=1 Tax=Caenorhabditis briggsae TaxID=6238 RepID=A0AAE9E4C1_CAEBR|nr:hypothetical protein L5515_002540 [Caenorhabditis briggsae]